MHERSDAKLLTKLELSLFSRDVARSTGCPNFNYPQVCSEARDKTRRTRMVRTRMDREETKNDHFSRIVEDFRLKRMEIEGCSVQ